MQIIHEKRTVKVEQYAQVFEWNDMPGAGFSFPCTKRGVILRSDMHPEGLRNLEKCLDGTYAVLPQGIRDYSYTYREPAQGQCSCGRTVDLEDFTNTCACGLEYNACGQLLAPRCHWEDPWEED